MQTSIHQRAAQTGTSSDTDYFIKFVAKNSYHHPELNQISPLEEFTVFLAHLKDLDSQRMIQDIREGQLSSNFVNFESRLWKNRNRLENIHDVLRGKYFDHIGEVTSKQIVESDNVVDNMIRALHDYSMQRQHGSSKMLQQLRKRFTTLPKILRFSCTSTTAKCVSRFSLLTKIASAYLYLKW